MRVLDEDTLGNAWMRVLSLPDLERHKAFETFGREQAGFTAFLRERTASFSEEGLGLLVNLCVTLWQVVSWRNGEAPKCMPEIPQDSLEPIATKRDKSLGAYLAARIDTEEALDEVFERAIDLFPVRQVGLLGFAVETLLDVFDENEISREEALSGFELLTVFVEAVDKSAQ